MLRRPPYGQRLLLALTVSVISVTTSVTANAQARQLSAAERRIVAAEVAERLKDPAAAQFKWPAVKFPSPKGGLYCGFVNGKNGFGAYTGFTLFYGEAKLRNGTLASFSLIKIEAPDNDAYSREMFRTTMNLCRGFGVLM